MYSLKLEVEQLKEVADIARHQVSAMQTNKDSNNIEMESLRQQVLDLQVVRDSLQFNQLLLAKPVAF